MICPEGSLQAGEVGWQGPEGALQGAVLPNATPGGTNPALGSSSAGQVQRAPGGPS